MNRCRFFVILAISATFTMACRDRDVISELREFKTQAQLEDRNISFVERFFQEMGTGTVERAMAAVDATFSPDTVVHMAAGSARGIDQVKTAFRYDHLTWSDFHYSLKAIMAEGDLVVTRGEFGGIQSGPIMGIAPTGKKIAYPFIYVFRLENAKVKEWWGDFDSYFSMMTQLGMELKPRSPQ